MTKATFDTVKELQVSCLWSSSGPLCAIHPGGCLQDPSNSKANHLLPGSVFLLTDKSLWGRGVILCAWYTIKSLYAMLCMSGIMWRK